jgi:hypothetical protein
MDVITELDTIISVFDDSYELAEVLREFASEKGGYESREFYYLMEVATSIEGLYDRVLKLRKGIGNEDTRH